ncbi:MAG: hypothetical protein KAU62_00295, partial [Candidatus Heimdallarchaeota archaeon]|nr:hypothetical protein [Candidatus Heimdallarchaeota archaeon]MCK4609570.1 hypothetical protein [Candidatus Heimdallarchaeota archaeon]
MSDTKKDLQRRVTVRLEKERFEQISSLVKRKLYRDISGFLRTSVELLLFWENEFELEQIHDSLLRASVETRLVKAHQIAQMLPNVTQEFLEREQRIRKDREKLINDVGFFVKFGEEIKMNRRTLQSETRASIKYFLQGVKEMNEAISDPTFKKQLKEWEKRMTV